MNILKFSSLLIEKRKDKGIREFARELSVSPATLSRIERGNLPDLETFEKLCSALSIDPADVLDRVGAPSQQTAPAVSGVTAVHFKADAHYTPEAAKDLASLILAAQDFARRRG